MTSKLLRVLRHVHAWGGAILALLIMLISLTGTFLVWKQEYLWLTVPQARVDFSPTPESLALIGKAVGQHFDNDDVISIQFATSELPLTLVTLANNRFAYLDTQGGIVDEWQANGRFEEWVYDLHHRLLLDELGLNIVGLGAMVTGVLVLVGVAAYWPFRKGFTRGLILHNLNRRQLLLTHRNLGIVVVLPFLLSLVTGVILVFPGQTEALLLEDLRSAETYSNAMVENLDNITGANSGDWLPAMERAQAVFPGAVIRSAQVPGSYSYYLILGLQQKGEWNRQGLSRVYIDTDGGYMDIRMDALGFPLIERSYNTVYPLHTGKINSLLYKFWLTIVGLSVFLLGSIGLVSFIKKYTNKGIGPFSKATG